VGFHNALKAKAVFAYDRFETGVVATDDRIRNGSSGLLLLPAWRWLLHPV
jgi:hypothetical protein